MRVAALEIREQKREIPEEFGVKNALARIVRRRWPRLTIDCVRAEWALTEAEARGVVYAQASQRTIDKIIKSRNGGWRLVLELTEAVLGLSLGDFIEGERARLATEQRQAEADERALSQMASRLPALLSVGAERAGGLRARADGEGRSLARGVVSQRDRGASR